MVFKNIVLYLPTRLFFAGNKMDNGKQKLGLRIVAGVLVAVLIIVGVFASGVTFPSLESKPKLGDEQGSLTILLMDAPVEVDELWINVTGVAVHKITEEEQTDVQEEQTEVTDDQDGWIPISLSGASPNELYFDLLKYRMDNEDENSLVLNLASGYTAEGIYNKVRIDVSNATARYYERDDNGDIIYDPVTEKPIIARNQILKVPPKHIDVITKFTIDTQNPVVVLIDMQPDWIAISHSGNLRPVIKAIISQQLPENTQIETIESGNTEPTTEGE
jgi:hypothetical protein